MPPLDATSMLKVFCCVFRPANGCAICRLLVEIHNSFPCCGYNQSFWHSITSQSKEICTSALLSPLYEESLSWKSRANNFKHWKLIYFCIKWSILEISLFWKRNGGIFSSWNQFMWHFFFFFFLHFCIFKNDIKDAARKINFSETWT